MIQIGRQGQLYGALEGTFGTVATFAATDALRHLNFQPNYDPKNRVNSPEKKQGPGRFVRFDRRETAQWSLEALIRPSGTINTLPEASEIFEAAFGSKTNVALSTTVASGGTVTGATLASGTGLVVGGAVLITCPDGKKRLRKLASVAGAVVTWTPSLPTGQTPANAAAVKSCTVYTPTTILTASLSLAHYLKKSDLTAGLARAIVGAMVDRFALTFDANDEPHFQASGPAKKIQTAAAQPGGFTTVGGNPPSGITGELMLGAATQDYKFLKLAVEITNGAKLRNESYGFTSAEEGYRVGRRDVTVALDARVEDQTAIYDLAIAGTNQAVFLQTGFTEGNCMAVVMPGVEFKVPDTDDPEEEVNWPFKGMALESAVDANDEIVFILG
jgi:hypothetical protein